MKQIQLSACHLFALFLPGCFFLPGCLGNREVPNLESVESIEVSLHDSTRPGQWNIKGNVPEKHWEQLLSHFSTARYTDSVLKWTGLALIEIKTKEGKEISIVVFETRDSPGCYESGGYFQIPDENKFVEDVRQFLEIKNAE